MSTKSVQGRIEAAVCVRQRVTISRWVNEPYPAWDQILTAHDVARLIRRSPWVFSSMAAVNRRRQRFRGKKIGWLKGDIFEWIARSSRHWVAGTSAKTNCCRRHRPGLPNQQLLPLRYASARAASDTSSQTVALPARVDGRPQSQRNHDSATKRAAPPR